MNEEDLFVLDKVHSMSSIMGGWIYAFSSVFCSVK